jgi:hypothetical protein
MTSFTPSIAELRDVAQPPATLERASGEHWAGRLYMRRISPYVTRALLRTPLSANGVTWLMVPSGLLAAGCLTLPGIGGALGAVAFVQLQLLFDCCDGEVARWRGESSPAGVYLDRIAHHVTDAGAARGARRPGRGWLGQPRRLDDARARRCRPRAAHQGREPPRRRRPRRVGPAARRRPRHRRGAAPRRPAAARAALWPSRRSSAPSSPSSSPRSRSSRPSSTRSPGDLVGTRALLVALVPVAILTAIGHLVAILTSDPPSRLVSDDLVTKVEEMTDGATVVERGRPGERLPREHEDEFHADHHVYEPHRVGLPPMRSYLRELWRRRQFAFEMSRTTLRAQHFDTAFGQLWLVLNPLLLTCVYFLLVRHPRAAAGAARSSSRI